MKNGLISGIFGLNSQLFLFFWTVNIHQVKESHIFQTLHAWNILGILSKCRF